MKIRITKTNVATLKPGTYFDAVTIGLVLRVGTRRRSWQLRARVNGDLRQARLGLYPLMGIGDARIAARDAIRRLEVGLPAEPQARETAPPRRTGELSLGGLIERYEQYKRGRGTGIKNLGEQLRVLRVNLEPWLGMPAAAITKADLREARDIIAERGKLGASNKLLAYCQPVFKWASQEDLIEHNFISDIVRLGAPQTRDRFLDDGEIASLWRATHGANTISMASYCRLLRFLTLTGQRLGEAAAIDWQDVTNSVWHQADNKAGRPHNVPLSDLALRCMNGRAEAGLVFAGESGRMSGWSKLKRKIDRRCEITEPWRVHDVRRTCASGMQRLGVDREVIAACLNHSIPGVTSVYMRDKLEPQKREALQAWAGHVTVVVK